MLFKLFTLLSLMFFLLLGATGAETDIARVLAASADADNPGNRITSLSSHFLGTPYKANTLIGGPEVREVLVIDLTGFDCFTFIDTVEALRRSALAIDFPRNLREVRYLDGDVDYKKRRHFFSDWLTDGPVEIVDMTARVGIGRSQHIEKNLNLKGDGGLWVPGIAVSQRTLDYIPTSMVDAQILSTLQTGDYVGIYSDAEGLDVSHTGLIIKQEETVLLRHASSRREVNKVLDEDFWSYLQNKPGFVVYRVKHAR